MPTGDELATQFEAFLAERATAGMAENTPLEDVRRSGFEAGYQSGRWSTSAPLIRGHPGLRLTAVVETGDPREGRPHRGQRRGDPAPPASTRWSTSSVVPPPNRTHVPIASEALRAGLPVVVDKPLAATAEEALELAALARGGGACC